MMRPEIIPAILATNEEELKNNMDKVAGLSKRLHLDYCDGSYAKTVTVDWQTLLDLPEYYHDNILELHLMAADPLPIAIEAAESGFQRIIVHSNALEDNQSQELKRLSEFMEIYLALRVEVNVEKALELLDSVSGILILTVPMGKQGQAFKSQNLEKVSALRSYGFTGPIEIDGGINLETIDQVLNVDVDALVVGGALQSVKDPQKVYNTLVEKISKAGSV